MHESQPVSDEKFRGLVKKAGKITICSWCIGVGRDDDSGRARPIVVFADESGGTFVHAFSFGSPDEVLEFCNRLAAASNITVQKNRNGGLA